jgi:hypothetical protein
MLREATAGDPDAQAMLAARRADGVTDDDLRGWWARSDRTRQEIRRSWKYRALIVYVARKRAGNTDDEAALHTMRHVPTFASVEELARRSDANGQVGDDRPLAEELWPRVIQRYHGDLYFADLRGHKSAEAFIRADMRLNGWERHSGAK